MDDKVFKGILEEMGDSLEEINKTAAFNVGDETFFRSNSSIEEFLSDLVHEGTHALDNVKIKNLLKSGKSNKEVEAIMGNNWSFEKRAYFHERAFQEATGISTDFKNIEDMIVHIKRWYDKY